MKPSIAPEFFNRNQIHQYFGGNVGLNVIDSLMNEGTLPAVVMNQTGLRVVRRRHLEDFADRMELQQIQTNAISTFPTGLMFKKNPKKSA